MSNVLPFPALSPTTVGDVIALYLQHTRHEQTVRTYADRKAILDAFAAAHGQLPLTAAKPYHLRLWIDAQERWRSDWTRKRAAGTVQRAMNWAVKLGIVDRNPFYGATFPAGERGQPCSLAEFQAMLRSTSAVFRRVLIFLRYTGCRPGEMASAEWAHLDAERACLELRAHKTARKTRKLRRIVLHPIVLKLLAWIAPHQPHERWIFQTAKGGRWTGSAIAWRIAQIREKAGIRADATLYGLRHLYCTQAVLSGVDLATLAVLAGHERITTTQHYLHLAQQTEHLQAAVGRIFRRSTS